MFPQAEKAGKSLVLFHSRQLRIITPHDSETPENMLSHQADTTQLGTGHPGKHSQAWS